MKKAKITEASSFDVASCPPELVLDADDIVLAEVRAGVSGVLLPPSSRL